MPAAVQQALASRHAGGFTLIEVVISLVVISVSLGAILYLYVQSAVRAEFSAYSLSAQMMALSGIEQCRAAKFDPRGSPPVDNLVSSNFPVKVDILDVGTLNGATTYGTNTTSITTIWTNPPLKMVQVDCVWTYPRRGRFTNSIYTYRAANQ
jgi:prepilin-type N-terminal cleavage/methylation domain-containing protein